MKTKRHIASWVLLAVFVPMVVLASLHVHPSAVLTETVCDDCVHHHCSGHITVYDMQMHACVLCQMVSLPFLAATVVAVILYQHVVRRSHGAASSRTSISCCGIVGLRAPPTLSC
jgi:hypothetical protein